LVPFWPELEPEPNIKNGRISGQPEPDILYIPSQKLRKSAPVSNPMCLPHKIQTFEINFGVNSCPLKQERQRCTPKPGCY